MRWLRVPVFTLAVAGLLVACTLLDPLDDISGGAASSSGGGKRDGGVDTSSGSTSGDDDDVVGDDDDIGGTSTSSTSSTSGATSGSPAFVCTGPKETEPNDATPSPLSSPQSCGTLGANAEDTDKWSFTNLTANDQQVVIKVEAPETLNLLIEAGTNVSSSKSGGTLVTSLKAGATLTITFSPSASAEDIPYRIIFTGG